MRNVSNAVKYLKKELDRLKKENELWELKKAVAHENAAKTASRIMELSDQISLIEGKTAFASL